LLTSCNIEAVNIPLRIVTLSSCALFNNNRLVTGKI
jgi:hypothetical protein